MSPELRALIERESPEFATKALALYEEANAKGRAEIAALFFAGGPDMIRSLDAEFRDRVGRN